MVLFSVLAGRNYVRLYLPAKSPKRAPKRGPLHHLSYLAIALCFAFFWASAAVAQTGAAAWGWGVNHNTELDDGTAFSRHVPVPMRDLQDGVQQLASGYQFTLVLKGDGTVWGWGAQDEGQVGNGSVTINSMVSPVQVRSEAKAIAAGMAHSVALKTDGTVWAWGDNNRGQVGDGTTVRRRPKPVQVSNLKDVIAVAAGAVHSMALKADHTVWTWGANNTGQIGDDTRVSRRRKPVQVEKLDNVIAIAAGWGHNLALKADGTVWAWGDGSDGDLGNGQLAQKNAPVQVQGLTNVKAISAGATHSLALKTDGTVWAWGYRLDGSTLDDNNISTVPTQVPDLGPVIAIASGEIHNLALMTDRTVRAWGQNSSGQLGNDSTMISRTPVTVLNLTDVVNVVAGYSHSMALTPIRPATPVDACRLRDWACSPEPQLTPGHIGLQCDSPDCIIVDRVPKNCQSKYPCPGCFAGGLCPPVYQMSFEGLSDVWTLGLVHADGTAVPYALERTPTGYVLRFRPSKEKFISGRIGDYVLVFQMGPKGVPGRKYDVKTELKVDNGGKLTKNARRIPLKP